MSEDKKTRKIISIIVILAFVFQFSNIVLLHAQEGNEVLNQFNKAKRAYLSGQYVDSRNRLERIIDIINMDPEKKTILGKCYLLLGVIYEKEGKTELARENYRRAKTDFGIEEVEEVNFSQLHIYRELIEIIKIDAQFKKARNEYETGQYVKVKDSFEKLIGKIKEISFDKKGGASILERCYLYLGAIYEKEDNATLAEENYRKSIGEKVDVDVEGMDVERLPLLNAVVKKINNEKQFEKARTEYLNGQYVNAKSRIDRTISKLNMDGLKQEDILGKCYLLLGAIYEKDGNIGIAEENYQKAKKYGIKSIPDIDFNELVIGNKIMKDRVIEIEKKYPTAKRKFTVHFMAVGVVVVVVLAILLLKKKAKYTLTATRGDGVIGTPTSGISVYKKNSTVFYNYSLQAGYTNLVVTLDGTAVPSSGTITMNGNHTLSATSNKQYTLTVTKGTGVDGTPNTGTTNYNDGVIVNYNYTLQNGYSDLVVTIDGSSVPASGNIIMNDNHTLIARATDSKPSVNITSPQNESSFPRGTVVTIDITATSTTGIDKIEFYIDGALLDTDSVMPYSFTWNTVSYLEGPHTIRALVYDTEQRTNEAQITVIITVQ